MNYLHTIMQPYGQQKIKGWLRNYGNEKVNLHVDTFLEALKLKTT